MIRLVSLFNVEDESSEMQVVQGKGYGACKMARSAIFTSGVLVLVVLIN